MLTEENVLVTGFVIDFTQPVLLRAVGPTMQNLGVTGVLADPTISLYDGAGELIAANDNWKDTQQAEIAATGKAPRKDSEAAILRTVVPGIYTVVMTGKITLPETPYWKADPTLAVANARGMIVASNDDWQDTDEAQVQAYGLAPPNIKKSEMVIYIPRGNSTAIVRGKNNATGVAVLQLDYDPWGY